VQGLNPLLTTVNQTHLTITPLRLSCLRFLGLFKPPPYTSTSTMTTTTTSTMTTTTTSTTSTSTTTTPTTTTTATTGLETQMRLEPQVSFFLSYFYFTNIHYI
jgi:hypothetical protein